MTHLLFDLYGTLADADKSLLCVPARQLYRFGHDTFMVHDTPEQAFFAEFCEEFGGDPDELARTFAEMEASTEFFDGIPEVLRWARRRAKGVHLLSNTGHQVRSFVQEREDVFSLFDTLTFSFAVGAAKPDEKAFRAALEKIGAEPEDCVSVGDSERRDLAPARELGMGAVRFSGRESPAAVLRERLEHVFE